jgi:hypothetical protein
LCKKAILPLFHTKVERNNSTYHKACFILREDMYMWY